jgi:RNA polymerase primary sigma factor
MSKKYINFNDDESISKYFKDVKKTKLLTPEEEVELAIQIKNGSQVAIDKLVSANLKFVVSVAKEYQGQGLQLSDLISEGNLGMVKAAKRYDHTRGFRFISYAVWWIRQSIMQSLNDNSRTIRYPSNVINKISLTKKKFEKFEIDNCRQADFTDFDDDSLVDFKSLAKCSSFNEIINDSGSEISELLIDNDYDYDDIFNEGDGIIKNELVNMLSELSDREREIINCYFGIDKDYDSMTLEVIGEKYNLTKERIRQIKEKALRKLRHNADNLFDIINK